MTTGNASFPTPVPALAALTATCDDLDAANQAYDFTRSRVEKSKRDLAFSTLKDQMHEFSGYVQATSQGDKEKIESAGLRTRRAASPPEPLPAPADLRARVTAYPGRIDLRWNGVRRRLMYQLEVATDPNAANGWSMLAMTSKNRYVAEGLTSNTVYYFRVVAIGALGASPVSDAANAKAA